MVRHGQALPQATTESAKEARKAFYCELCSKGYARQNDFDAHENSYDHQHRKRLKDLCGLTRDPNAAAKARAAENEAAGLKSIDLASLSTSSSTGGAGAGKKKPVFKSTLQPQNAVAVPSAGSSTVGGGSGAGASLPGLGMTGGEATAVGSGGGGDDDPSGMVRNGWAGDAYRPRFVVGCGDGKCEKCVGNGGRIDLGEMGTGGVPV